MSTKKQPAKLAKPARASRPKKTSLAAQLQAFADDARVRSPLRNLVWRQKATKDVGNCEGEGLYWGDARPRPTEEQRPIGRRAMKRMRKAAQ